MPYLVSLGGTLRKPLPYLKSAPSNFCNYKIFLKKQKCQIWEQMPCLGIIRLEF